MIVALTPDGEIVLAEEFRPPMNAPVVSLPSGLIGDEGPEEADRRRAPRARRRRRATRRRALELLTRGPGSAGQSSEMITFFLAQPARARPASRRRTTSGRSASTSFPSRSCRDWARAREAEGAVIDPKIWAGLYLAGRAFRARHGAPTPRYFTEIVDRNAVLLEGDAVLLDLRDGEALDVARPTATIRSFKSARGSVSDQTMPAELDPGAAGQRATTPA